MIPARLHRCRAEPVAVDAAAPPVALALEVQFCGAHFAGKTVVFPCDCRGHVDLDTLNKAEMQDYLFARVVSRLGYARGRLIRWVAAVREDGAGHCPQVR